MRYRWLLAALAICGCDFVIEPLAPLTSDGAALGGDAAVTNDGAGPPPDLAMEDLAVPPDLAPPPDLGPPFVPSHVSPNYFAMGTGNLTVAASIDTGALTVDGQAPPAGTVFVDDGGLAVLAVHDLVVAMN